MTWLEGHLLLLWRIERLLHRLWLHVGRHLLVLLLRRLVVHLVRLLHRRRHLFVHGLRVEDSVRSGRLVDRLRILVHVGKILVSAELGVRSGALKQRWVRLNDRVEEIDQLAQV